MTDFSLKFKGNSENYDSVVKYFKTFRGDKINLDTPEEKLELTQYFAEETKNLWSIFNYVFNYSVSEESSVIHLAVYAFKDDKATLDDNLRCNRANDNCMNQKFYFFKRQSQEKSKKQ